MLTSHYIIHGTPSAFDFQAFSESTQHAFKLLVPLVELGQMKSDSVIALNISAQAGGLMKAVKLGVRAAQLGYAAASDIIALSRMVDSTSLEERNNYLKGTYHMAKKAHGEAQEAHEAFRDVRRRIYQLTDNVSVKLQEIETSLVVLSLKLPSSAHVQRSILVRSVEELRQGIIVLEKFGGGASALTQWWDWIQVETHVEEDGQASVALDASSLRQDYVVEQWELLRKQFADYNVMVAKLEDSYPRLVREGPAIEIGPRMGLVSVSKPRILGFLSRAVGFRRGRASSQRNSMLRPREEMGDVPRDPEIIEMTSRTSHAQAVDVSSQRSTTTIQSFGNTDDEENIEEELVSAGSEGKEDAVGEEEGVVKATNGIAKTDEDVAETEADKSAADTDKAVMEAEESASDAENAVAEAENAVAETEEGAAEAETAASESERFIAEKPVEEVEEEANKVTNGRSATIAEDADTKRIERDVENRAEAEAEAVTNSISEDFRRGHARQKGVEYPARGSLVEKDIARAEEGDDGLSEEISARKEESEVAEERDKIMEKRGPERASSIDWKEPIEDGVIDHLGQDEEDDQTHSRCGCFIM